MNIFILDKGYNQLGMLSNEGANPQAPYFDDLYVQELETGADTFEFTTLSTSASESMLEIGNHIVFNFNNRQRLFAISTLELEHANGMNVIRVYAEGVGFQLLETYMGEFGEDEDGDGEVDSGEYLTYGQFLERVLADTDWSYQIVSGDLNNINMGREVTFPKGKNIYALLQDSMQVFSGVELEFRGGYSGGGLSKTIYAYANGGRGSFVGKRFEYGINVKGIKKTQEIVDEMDENVILYEGLINVDGLNVQLGYDVDFALRSHEVEELEIGDTHYIIDNDFNPPLQITARIGKIEVSFSDPTKNKCYLANFKKITGSKPDDPDGEDVEDIIDDKMDEIEDLIDEKIEEVLDDLGELKEHTHDRLVYHDSSDGSEHPLVYKWGGTTEAGGDDQASYILLETDEMSLEFRVSNVIDERNSWADFCMFRRGSLASETPSNNVARIYTSVGDLKPDYDSTQYIGDFEHRWDYGYINNIKSNHIEAAEDIKVGGDLYVTGSIICDTGGGEEIDLSDYATKEFVNNAIDDIEMPDLTDYATKEFVNDAIDDIELTPGPVGEKGEQGEPGEPGEDGVSITNVSINSSNHLITTLSDNTTIDAGALPSGGSGVDSEYIEVVDYENEYINDKKINMKKTTEIFGDLLITSIGGELYKDGCIVAENDISCYGNMTATIGHFQDVCADVFTIGIIDMEYFIDNGRNGIIFNGDIRMENNILYAKEVNTSSDKSLKENIRYIDDSVMTTSDDSLEKTDLHDFIVNQVNICEYNFIGDDSDKIGFIANDYEGTKVGDKIVSRHDNILTYDVNNLLFATIGALQEEVRIKDEKIASLEARLAKIEEMLGINNN